MNSILEAAARCSLKPPFLFYSYKQYRGGGILRLPEDLNGDEREF